MRHGNGPNPWTSASSPTSTLRRLRSRPTRTASISSILLTNFGSCYERNSGAGVRRRLPMRRRSLRALFAANGAEYLPLPYVPEGLWQLLCRTRRRAHGGPRLDQGPARNLRQLGACRARFLPRLRHTAVLPLPQPRPDLGLDRQPRRAGAREADDAVRDREPAPRLLRAC